MTRAPASPSSSLSRRATNNDGFVIVAVLWILGALAALVSIYSLYVVESASTFAAHTDKLRADALVTAALELTAYRLTTPAEPRVSHGSFDFRLGPAKTTVAFHPENARIDLNAAPKELLSGLFVGLGARSNDAQEYADRIVAWRTAPSKADTSEASSYRDSGLKYVPRGGPFPHVNELMFVRGLPTTLAERALPFVTVHSGSPQVNVIVAAPRVVAALPGMTPDRLNAFLAQRELAPGLGQALLLQLGTSRGYATSEGSKASRVEVSTIFDNGRRFNAEIVIVMTEQGNEPYMVLSFNNME